MTLFTSTIRTQHRILDLDIENRPLSYWFGDVTTSEITAIAWSWADEEGVRVEVLEPPPDHETSRNHMLLQFLDAYEQADMVTGHYLIRHDLPIINAGLLEAGLPLLGSKMVQDTKIHLIRRSGQPATQEHLGKTFATDAPKVGMSQMSWREANRLTADGLEKTKERVVGDVRQHKQLRLALLGEGLLRPPSMWTP